MTTPSTRLTDIVHHDTDKNVIIVCDRIFFDNQRTRNTVGAANLKMEEKMMRIEVNSSVEKRKLIESSTMVHC